MKLRNYERRSGIVFFISIFFGGIILFFIYSFFSKVSNYYLISGVVFRDNLLEVIISEKEMEILYKNGYVYIENRKYKYNIVDTVLNVLIKDGVNYNIVYIECELHDEKENDVFQLVFMKDKIRLFEMFKSIWEGE